MMLTDMKKVETRLIFKFGNFFNGDAYMLAEHLMFFFQGKGFYDVRMLDIERGISLPTILSKTILENNKVEIRVSKRSLELKVKEQDDLFYTYNFIGYFNDLPEKMGMLVSQMDYIVVFKKKYSDFVARYCSRESFLGEDWEFVFNSSIRMHCNSCKINESIARWKSDDTRDNKGIKLKKIFRLPLDDKDTRRNRLEYLENFFSMENSFLLERN